MLTLHKRYCEAPEVSVVDGTKPSVFLAGGITNCPDWQSGVIKELLSETNLNVFSPRRANWNFGNLAEEDTIQIHWEHEHLDKADIHLYWFPEETLCPIVLFELGKYLRSGKPLYIGCHPNYQRRRDVEIQSRIEHPNIVIYDNLEDMVSKMIKNHSWIR